MVEEIVGQFIKSGIGSQVLSTLQGHGLSAEQATQAIGATAEGVASNATSAGPEAMGLLTNLLGGGMLGGLGSMLGGAAAQAPAGPAQIQQLVSNLAGPVSQFVAQKVGINPAVAQTAVSAVLPKLIEFVSSKSGATPTTDVAGSVKQALGGLFS